MVDDFNSITDYHQEKTASHNQAFIQHLKRRALRLLVRT